MAKMTIAALQTAMNTYVAAAKQQAAWTASTNNFTGLLDKIGKTVTLDGLYNDKLPELEGTELPLGKTIEEYFVDLTLPEAFSTLAAEGAKDVVPALPSVEAVVYNYTLGRQKIKTTEPYDNIERAAMNEEVAANALTKISEKLQNSYDITRFAAKKQLLGNAITKCVAGKTNADVYKAIAKPIDTETAEAFITQVKKDVEDASFAHEGGLAKALIGASPELILFVKKGVMPEIAVKAMAGAFHNEELAIPATIKIVDDFGTYTGTSGKEVFALLADPRGIKLHNSYNATRTSMNADGDFMNIVRHFEDTGFISKYTYMKVYETV